MAGRRQRSSAWRLRTISILMALNGFALVAAGVLTRFIVNRLLGLGLVTLVILKLYFSEMWLLTRVYRIAAFTGLGALLLVTSYLIPAIAIASKAGGPMTRLLASLLALVACLRADFDPALWRLRRPLVVPAGPTLVVVRLNPGIIYQAAQPSLADLRLLHQEVEVPYVLETLSLAEWREAEPEILDRSVAPAGLQVTLDLQRSFRHQRLRIATNQVNFRQLVRIESAEQPGAWSLVLDDGYIFHTAGQGKLKANLTVAYPVSTRRYLRVTFPAWKKLDAVTRVWVGWLDEHPEGLQTVALVDPRRTDDPKTQITTLEADFGAESSFFERICLETAVPALSRAVEIDTSAHGLIWSHVASRTLRRSLSDQHFVRYFPGQHRRHLRLRIYNRDDQPLPACRLRFEVAARQIAFLSQGPGQYWLYYGNMESPFPSYDLAALLAKAESTTGSMLPAGPAEPNPAWRPKTKPFTERYPLVLHLVLLVAVLSLGCLSLKFLRKLKSPVGQ